MLPCKRFSNVFSAFSSKSDKLHDFHAQTILILLLPYPYPNRKFWTFACIDCPLGNLCVPMPFQYWSHYMDNFFKCIFCRLFRSFLQNSRSMLTANVHDVPRSTCVPDTITKFHNHSPVRLNGSAPHSNIDLTPLGTLSTSILPTLLVHHCKFWDQRSQNMSTTSRISLAICFWYYYNFHRHASNWSVPFCSQPSLVLIWIFFFDNSTNRVLIMFQFNFNFYPFRDTILLCAISLFCFQFFIPFWKHPSIFDVPPGEGRSEVRFYPEGCSQVSWDTCQDIAREDPKVNSALHNTPYVFQAFALSITPLTLSHFNKICLLM